MKVYLTENLEQSLYFSVKGGKHFLGSQKIEDYMLSSL